MSQEIVSRKIPVVAKGSIFSILAPNKGLMAKRLEQKKARMTNRIDKKLEHMTGKKHIKFAGAVTKHEKSAAIEAVKIMKTQDPAAVMQSPTLVSIGAEQTPNITTTDIAVGTMGPVVIGQQSNMGKVVGGALLVGLVYLLMN